MTCRCGPTVVGDVGDLEAPRAVGLVGLEADPEPAGAGGEGDGPLVRLARLVGGDGRGQRWTDRETHASLVPTQS